MEAGDDDSSNFTPFEETLKWGGEEKQKQKGNGKNSSKSGVGGKPMEKIEWIEIICTTHMNDAH